ncbi:flagellar biosynthetic protein FliO [Evansella tamaricis]|uniref:Flagellar biosynthetic protein FliO n=1 Tax=Evansella tamaricis TaxID=2069301 RepID=A0ABS6JLI7_9BACI|nr:flagellar biosynthetic protein FliO [Evansella tamaricis]MBU9714541.1 flagellar biosynthetic protein FliO [Evansella tamaricis]
MNRKIYIKPVIIVITLILLLFPTTVFGEVNWNTGNGTVGNMFNGERDLDLGETDADDVPPYDSLEEEETNQEELMGGGTDQNLFFLSLQMFLALAFVIVLIYALLKFINNRSRSFRNNSTIEGIGGVALGSNRSVQMVRIGSKIFIVGVGDTVNLLKEINDPDEIQNLLDDQRSHDVLEQPVTKLTNWVKETFYRSTVTEDKSFQSLFKKELKGVKESQEKLYSALKEKDK